MWKTRKERKRKNKEQGRTLSRQNFHPNQNELRRDHKSHKGKSNETTTGYKSLWCFGPYGPPTETCVHRIYPRRKWNSSFADSGGGRREVNEHRLHREMEPSEKASCSINVWTILVVRSVRSVILRTSWKISEKRRKKKNGKSWYTTYYELLIYDWLLRQTRSMPRGCLPLFVPSFFVPRWWPWKTFHRLRFFLMDGKYGSWEFFLCDLKVEGWRIMWERML